MKDTGSIVHLLDDISILMEVNGDNPFRVRAYRKAAQVIQSTTEDIAALVKNKTLTTLNGIGPGIADTITEFCESGESKILNELRKKFPDGILEMLKVSGLGPAKVRILFDKLDIKTIDELQKACEKHQLQNLEGFGKKSEENILQGIFIRRRAQEHHLYPDAFSSANQIVSFIHTITGNYRRYRYFGLFIRKRKTRHPAIDSRSSKIRKNLGTRRYEDKLHS